MKIAPIRARRRADFSRLVAAGFELETRANQFKERQGESPPCVRAARLALYDAAIAFASAVDGETETPIANVTPIKAKATP